MKTIIEIFDGLDGRTPSKEEHATLVLNVLRFIKSCKLALPSLTPKFHYLLHLVFDTRRVGDPSNTATWVDESLNKELSSVGALAYSSVFHQRVLLYMREVLLPTAKRALGRHRAFMARQGGASSSR